MPPSANISSTDGYGGRVILREKFTKGFMWLNVVILGANDRTLESGKTLMQPEKIDYDFTGGRQFFNVVISQLYDEELVNVLVGQNVAEAVQTKVEGKASASLPLYKIIQLSLETSGSRNWQDEAFTKRTSDKTYKIRFPNDMIKLEFK